MRASIQSAAPRCRVASEARSATSHSAKTSSSRLGLVACARRRSEAPGEDLIDGEPAAEPTHRDTEVVERVRVLGVVESRARGHDAGPEVERDEARAALCLFVEEIGGCGGGEAGHECILRRGAAIGVPPGWSES